MPSYDEKRKILFKRQYCEGNTYIWKNKITTTTAFKQK